MSMQIALKILFFRHEKMINGAKFAFLKANFAYNLICYIFL